VSVTSDSTPSTGSKVDPCVAVIGMGRSGTSATAGLLVNLGLTGPRSDDLIPATSSNERGHWESRSVIGCNMRLLLAAGGNEGGPPPVTLDWDGVPGYAARKIEAEKWFAATYAGGPIMVKDPRMCLTLTFWRSAIPVPMAAIFVLRNPLHVARSLIARDGLPMSLGLALWDRHIRSAVLGLESLPTLVIHYDDMLSQPMAAQRKIVSFLEHVGVNVPPDRERVASSWLDPGLRHQRSETDAYSEMACVQLEMFQQLTMRDGMHDAWQAPEDFPEAPLWVDDVIQLRREHVFIRRDLRKLRKSRLYQTASKLRSITSR
jgi:hypothetical protein